ncbi:MoaC family-domain-containing protein [Tribonema minus]|uniref:cyclic pyranopterin monophosphate synthase n=1 Tax=Tribonema minus TaxID=303371 RepID=A0A835ZDT1_9STRA|nr:MoaC family-domain-containing protein [Tribonema minus]
MLCRASLCRLAAASAATKTASKTAWWLNPATRPDPLRCSHSGAGIGGSSSAGSDTHDLSTHVSSDGTTPMMVDVGHKTASRRSATARTRVRLPPDVINKMNVVGGEVVGKKGPIFTTAIIAGVLGAKNTSSLIPFCHPLPIEDCKVDMELTEGNFVIQIDCTVRVTHKTGVEMEAMTGASVAALTVYDMLKGLSHDIVIESTQLLAKEGGKRPYSRAGQPADAPSKT